MLKYLTLKRKSMPFLLDASNNILHPVYNIKYSNSSCKDHSYLYLSRILINRTITTDQEPQEFFSSNSHESNNNKMLKDKSSQKQGKTRRNLVINYIQKTINGDKSLLNVIESIADLKLAVILLNHYISKASIMGPINCSQSMINYGFFQENQIAAKEIKQQDQNIFHSSIHTNRGTKNLPTLTEKRIKSEVVITDDNKKLTLASSNTSMGNGANSKNDSTPNHKASNSSSTTKILELNDKNFKSAVTKHKILLVMFYAPWCQYCKDFKPLFFRAAKELPKEAGSLAVCDGDASKKIALKYNVYVFPTLKLFCKGQYVTDYSGPRRSMELIKFMVTHSEKFKETETC